jgi:transposase-like protein
MAGRRSKLDDPEVQELVGRAFNDGQTRAQMAATFGVAPSTISVWKRDPRVNAVIKRLQEERIFEITRKVDGRIHALLQQEDLSLKDLLAIRKEFVGGAMRQSMEKADEETVAQAVEALEDNPNLAADLEKLLSGGSE